MVSLTSFQTLIVQVQNRGNEPDKQARDAAYSAKDAVVDAANKVQDKASNLFDSSKGSNTGEDLKQSAQKAGDKVTVANGCTLFMCFWLSMWTPLASGMLNRHRGMGC